MNSLRTRLLLSYVLLIVVTLAVIGVALLVALRGQALPRASAYQRLTDVVQGLAALPSASGGQLLRETPAQALRNLRQVAEAAELRVLIVELVDGQPHAAFDSRDKLAPDEPLQDYRVEASQGQGPGNRVRGAFHDAEGEWLFVSAPRLLDRFRPEREGNPQLILFAIPAPSPNLSAVFTWLGENLLVPILRAGLVGLVVAVVLSVLIARSVARPLQSVARAVQSVARGDFDQQAPETGPDEVQTVARAFNHMTRQVKASQQAQRDFVANVSHDLRTPLTSIQGFSQAILDGTAASPEGAHHAASVINDEAARLTRMVEALLDLARIESGEWRMERQVINPAAILRAVGERFTLRTQEQGIMLRVQTPDLPNTVGDGDRLAQVFTNLIDNALKHTPAGGTVTLDGRRADGGIELVVSDNGEGIPPEDLSRIFERFYQVDKSRRRDAGRKGAGLGLAISREIVQAHGGKIRAESVVGVGTRFVVWLPLPQPTDTTVARSRRGGSR